MVILLHYETLQNSWEIRFNQPTHQSVTGKLEGHWLHGGYENWKRPQPVRRNFREGT